MKEMILPASTPLAGADSLASPAQVVPSGQEKAAHTAPVMEMVSFRLTPGTTDNAFLAAALATEAPLRMQPGFLRRTLVSGTDGTWTDLVEWADMAKASAAAQAMMAEPAFQPFMAMIDMASVSMAHPALRWRMD